MKNVTITGYAHRIVPNQCHYQPIISGTQSRTRTAMAYETRHGPPFPAINAHFGATRL